MPNSKPITVDAAAPNTVWEITVTCRDVPDVLYTKTDSEDEVAGLLCAEITQDEWDESDYIMTFPQWVNNNAEAWQYYSDVLQLCRGEITRDEAMHTAYQELQNYKDYIINHWHQNHLTDICSIRRVTAITHRPLEETVN